MCLPHLLTFMCLLHIFTKSKYPINNNFHVFTSSFPAEVACSAVFVLGAPYGVPSCLRAWRMHVRLVLLGAPRGVCVRLRAWHMHMCALSSVVHAFDTCQWCGAFYWFREGSTYHRASTIRRPVYYTTIPLLIEAT